jgi:Tfp pilus assembly protein PilN
MFIGTTLGIEIGERDLRFAVIRTVYRKMRLVHSDEIIGFVDLSPEDRSGSVLQLIRKYRVSAGRVFLTLPRDRGIVRQIELPVELQEKLRPAVALQVEALCPWPVEEIYWDFAYEKPKSGATKLIVTIVIIPRANLDPWIEFFKTVRLPLSGAALSLSSCAHGVRVLWPDTGPTVVLNCESGYTEGAVIQDGRLTSVRQTGDDSPATVNAVVEQLLSMARLEKPENARLLIYGPGSAALEDVQPVSLGLENAPANASGRFGAICSALSVSKKTGFECNLVPENLRFRTSQLRLVPTYVLLLLTVLLGGAMLLREPYQSTLYASKLDHEIQLVAPQVKEVSSQAAELDRLAKKYRALLANLQNKDYSLESLRELAGSLPATAWLTNYTYQDGSVTITGVAASASEVQKVLEATALFKDVQFTSSVSRDADGKEHFSLKASIEVPR